MNRFTFLSLPVFIFLIAVVSPISPTAMAVDKKYVTVIAWKAGEPAKYGTRSKSVNNSTFYDDVNKSDYNPLGKNPKYRLFGNDEAENEFLLKEWRKIEARGPAAQECESGSELTSYREAFTNALSGRGNPLYPNDFDLSTTDGKDNIEKFPGQVSRSAAAVCKTENTCCAKGALAGNERLQEIILNNEFIPPFDAKNKDSESGICMSEFADAVTNLDTFCEKADSLEFNGIKFNDYVKKGNEVDNEKVDSLIAREHTKMTTDQEKVANDLCGYGAPTMYPTRYAGCYMAGYMWAIKKKFESHPSCASLIYRLYINRGNNFIPSQSPTLNEAKATDSDNSKTSVVGAPAEGKDSKAENLSKKP